MAITSSSDVHQVLPLAEELVAPAPIKRTPLPKFQLLVISLIQFAEPVTATIIYPFVVQLVINTGITGGDETKVGYFAGIIESVFFLTEGLTVYPWSLLSDVYGRRPVLLIGPLGLAVAMFAFGLTSNFYTLVVFRAIQGVCNGNIGVSKTVTAEITDATNMGQAYSLIPLMWSTGVTVGPLLGGLLANPAEQWQALANWKFLKDYPFFLACATAAVFPLISFLFGLFGLKESSKILAAKKRRNLRRTQTSSSEAQSLLDPSTTTYGTTTSPLDEHDPHDDPSEKAYTLRQLLALPHFSHILKCYCYLNFITMSLSCLQPLIYSTSIPNGGIGLEPRHIGAILASAGISAAFVTIWVIQPLIERFGPKRVMVVSLLNISAAFIMFPLESFFVQRAGRFDALCILCIVLQQIFGISGYAAYLSMQVLIVDGSPNAASLASANSVAQMLACVTRILAPSIASSLYSVSISKQLLGGYAVYAVLLLVNLMGVWNAAWLDGELKMLK